MKTKRCYYEVKTMFLKWVYSSKKDSVVRRWSIMLEARFKTKSEAVKYVSKHIRFDRQMGWRNEFKYVLRRVN